LAKIQCSDITRELKDLFSDAVIRDLAQASGFVQRERKLDVVAFFWTLVLGFGLKQSRTIAGLRCSYATATGETFVTAGEGISGSVGGGIEVDPSASRSFFKQILKETQRSALPRG